MRTSSRLLLTLMAIASAMTIFWNDGWAQGTRVRQIVVEGNQRVERATIDSYLPIRPGETVDAGKLDEALKSLFATDLFQDVSIAMNGDQLVINVVERPIINRIAYEGNKRVDDKALDAEVQIRPRAVYNPSQVQNAVTRILEIYKRTGYYSAKVEPKIIELDQNRVDLVFEIDEGGVTGVGGISFVGNNHYSDNTLRSVIQTTETAWYRFLTNDDSYDPDRLQFDQELLRRFYLARGYADFQVVSAIAELTPDGKEFYITFTLDEGPQYKFGKIEVRPQLGAVTAEQLQPSVTVKDGTTFDADAVEKTVQNMTDQIGNLGYAFTQIDPVMTKNPTDLLVDTVFDIREGPRVYVERIDIIGNVRTLDKVIRREMRLAEGDAFNTALLRRSRQRLQNLAYFESVDVRTAPGSAPDKVLITVRVAEKSTGELSFGAGFSTSDGVLGDIRFRERNLLGRGQDLTANLTLSGKRQLVQLSFTEPYFLDREIAAGFDLFRSRTDLQSESSYDETSTGGTLRLGYPLADNLNHSLRYTLRQDDIHNVDSEASPYIQQEEGDRITSLVGQSFSYDRRDTRFLASDGYYLRLDQDLAGLGGDNKFIRHEVKGEYYYSFVPDVVLNFGASGGYIHALGGEDIHLTNRFFVGGSNLRGFKSSGIGPRDTKTDDALGGNAYYTGSAELRFPLGLPKELRVFGRTFTDMGSLWDIDAQGPNLYDSSPSDLRISGGVGISWFSPLGPLSLDFAWPIQEYDADETELFRISFGTRF